MDRWIEQETALCQTINLNVQPKDLDRAYHANLSLKDQGRLSFDRWMQHALYDPKHGYYPQTSIGQDFTTASECSPLFARAIGHYLCPYFQAHPDHTLIEIGPGSGALCEALMLYWSKHLDHTPSYLLLEPSKPQQERQRARLAASLPPELFKQLKWAQTLSTPSSGVLFANEVLDAQVAKRSMYKKGMWYDLGLKLNEKDHLIWDEQPIENPLHFKPHPHPYIYEHRPHLHDWFQALSKHMLEGLLLFFDYGYEEATYYHPNRDQGTLTCFYRHQQHADPRRLMGQQDLSIHVDFSHFYRIIEQNHWSLSGYCTQADFIRPLPLDQIMTDQDLATLKMLTLPNEMGEVVKVISAIKGDIDPKLGHMMRDLSHKL